MFPVRIYSRTLALHARLLLHRSPALTAHRYYTPASHTQIPNQVQRLLEVLDSSHDLVAVHESSNVLARELKASDTQPQPQKITHDDVHRLSSIFQQLAMSGSPQDMKSLEQIVEVQLSLGLVLPPSIYDTIVATLLEAQHDEQLIQFLENVASSLNPSPFTLDRLHSILLKLATFSTPSTLRNFVMSMPIMGQTPTNETLVILMQAIWSNLTREDVTPSTEQLSSIVKQVAVQYSLDTEPTSSFLRDKYNEINHPEAATEIAQRLQAVSVIAQNKDALMPTTTLESNGESLSAGDMLELRRLSDSGLKSTTRLERWEAFLLSLLKAHDYDGAFEAYDHLRKIGFIGHPRLIYPLLLHVYRERNKSVSDASIDLVMRLYRDFLEGSDSLQETVDTTPHFLHDSILVQYGFVLHVLTSSTHYDKSHPLIERVLDDMTSRGLPIDKGPALPPRLVFELQKADGFHNMLDFYRSHRQNLDDRGFNTFLRELCRQSFRGDLASSFIKEYFSIVNDMRLQRVRITPQVYTTVLFYIGNMATKVQRDNPFNPRTGELIDQLTARTRRVHDFLTLDASISPDAALWNQLMNTYQRLRCFPDAYRVWQVMYLTRRYDQISVNIIFDACGYAKEYQVARQIFGQISRRGFRIDLHNWNTWMECLCRLGRFGEAAAVLCFEITKAGLQPNLSTIRIFWKFATQAGLWDQYHPLVAEHQADLLSRFNDHHKS